MRPFEHVLVAPAPRKDRSGSLPRAPIRKRIPIVLLPGFLGSDLTMAPMRSMLRNAGYDALPWNLGANRGPVAGLIEAVVARVGEVAEASGGRVALVGHSLGGLYCREVARITPQLVEMVVTLGSPIRALELRKRGNDLDIVSLIEYVSGRTVADLQRERLFCDMASPLPIRCVSIYSKRDRVAPWQMCLQIPSCLAENVEIDSTHRGMVVSRGVVQIISNCLSAVTDVAQSA